MASTAAPPLIVTHANGDAPTTTGIFVGLSFFLVQKLPSRSSFVNKIQSNGGRVVKLEAQADYIVADHVKPANCPPGSISYTFIDKAVDDGALPDAADHLAALPKGAVRPAATGFATKGTRTPFTAADDKELYSWVKRHEAKGASIKGNELYKELERRNGRHTFQAWRDRYVKRLHDQPPPGVDWQAVLNGDEAGEEAHVPLPRATQRNNGKPKAKPEQEARVVVGHEEFAHDAVEQLIEMGSDIERVQKDRIEEAWEAFAEKWSEHSANSWRKLWDGHGRAEYLKRKQISEVQPGAESAQSTSVNDTSNAEAEKRDESNATPERPQSSTLLKRKRGTPASHKKATHGRKKHKENDIFGAAGSDNADATDGQSLANLGANTSTDQPLPGDNAETVFIDSNDGQRQDSGFLSSDANKAAAMQLEGDALRIAREQPPKAKEQTSIASRRQVEEPSVNALNTSDANRAAAMQLDDDFERLSAQPTPQASQENSQNRTANQAGVTTDETMLPTSDLNRFADQQLRRESVENENRTSRPNGEVIEDDSHLHSEAIESQVGDDNPADLVAESGDALTEANLATQQEMQCEPHIRGQDLPQDDEMHDQTDYVHYLQSLQFVAPTVSTGGLKPQAQNEMLSAAQDLGSATKTSEAVALDSMKGPEYEDEPLLDVVSSQHEIDRIMDDALQWPSSPGALQDDQVPQHESPERSAQFETQIQYPRLPSQQPAAASASSPQAKVQYPDITNAVGKAQDRSKAELQARFKREVLGRASPDAPQRNDDSDNDATVVNTQNEEGDEDEIDLEVPEPEGGFGFSSSQAWPSQQPFEAYSPPWQRPREAAGAANNDGSAEDDAFDFTSSPPRASQRDHADRMQNVHQEAALPLSGGAASESRNFVPPLASGAIEITSSSSSSSSEHEPEAEREEDIQLDCPRALETQDIYNAETQAPDFDMPSPNIRPAVQTQDLYDADTQFPDFEMPYPGDNDISSSPPKPTTAAPDSQAALADTQVLSDDGVEDYINRMVFIEKYTEGAVIDALKCTSNRPELADLVLLDGRAGKGLPADVPGIWSAEDDEVLEGGNARALRGLEEQHGWTECEARLMWLQQYREDGEGGDE